MRKLFLILATLCLLPGGLLAQVVLTAQVDKTDLSADDELTLTVQVTGVSGNVVMPQLPSLPAFNVYSREVEQSSVNGDVTLLFRYILLPRFVGNATIGPVVFNYKGETYKTEPISVRIFHQGSNIPATAASTTVNKPAATKNAPQVDAQVPALEAALIKLAYAQDNKPFFLIAAVDNSSPYVNQPVTLAVRFYYSQSFFDAPYQKPTTSNLFMESDGDPREGTQAINGTLYRYTEQRYQLTAAAPGKASIGPASIRYRTGSSALSAFDRIFGTTSTGPEKTAFSNPITLSVRPLPQEGKPASFYGAVGTGYTILANADPTEVPAGEAVNLSVIVRGQNSLKATQDIRFPDMEGFKIYPAATTLKSGPGPHGTVQSYKVFKAVLVPTASGIYTIPAVEWSYFNPETAAYKTLRTDPIPLTVTVAKQDENSFNFAGNQPLSGGVQTLGRDIAYLKTNLAVPDSFLKRISQYGYSNILALVFVAVAGLFASLGRRSLARKKAFSTAKNALKKAANAQEIADTLANYLQQKLHCSTGSLPLKEIVARLRKQGVSPVTAEAFSILWQRLEAERFAPQAADQANESIAEQAKGLLKRLEEEIR